MVLRMDFLDKVHPWLLERDKNLRITKGSIIYIIPLERSKTKAYTLSTMKFNKGPNREGIMQESYCDKIEENMKSKKEVQIIETYTTKM